MWLIKKNHDFYTFMGTFQRFKAHKSQFFADFDDLAVLKTLLDA